MDIRHFDVPWSTRLLAVDLDSRKPLVDKEADTLSKRLHEMILERDKLDDDIRKVTQRLVLSGEAKVKAMREKEDNGTQP